MYKKIWVICCLLSTILFSSFGFAENIEDLFVHPAYVGIIGGYGSTTWQGLVPSDLNVNDAILLSTPSEVHEGGFLWGAAVGYEFSPYFAVEADYMHYPDASIYFDKDSLFTFENDGLLKLDTTTQTLSLFARVMLIIPKTNVRLYSSAGVARVQREDLINSGWRTSPTFGVGLNTNLNSRLMLEIGSTYTAGYGESELNPAKDFIPFLYSIFGKLAYRF